MAKKQNNSGKRTMPEVQLVAEEEYSETMKRLVDIQIAADAAVKSINKFKALIAGTF